jgi:hypothetical protein
LGSPLNVCAASDFFESIFGNWLARLFFGCHASLRFGFLKQYIARVIDSKIDFAAWLEVQSIPDFFGNGDLTFDGQSSGHLDFLTFKLK